MSLYSRNNSGLALSERSESKGFTLVELLVSIAIVSVILTVVLSNQSAYTERAALTNLADQIGLAISQAQAYGIGVRELSPGSSEFNASYGLTFSLLDTGSSVAYLSFADRNGNKIYDGDWSCPTGGASECLDGVGITHGNQIDSLCVITTAGASLCSAGGRIDVSFTRPSTEARILFFNPQGQQYSPSDVAGARVVLRSPKGTTRAVTVYNTGQVSVGAYDDQYQTSPVVFDYVLSHGGSLTITQGMSDSNQITLTLVAGTPETVSLSVSGVPAGTSAAFTPDLCKPACSSTLIIATSPTTPAGLYSIKVTGTPLSRTTQFKLNVKKTKK